MAWGCFASGSTKFQAIRQQLIRFSDACPVCSGCLGRCMRACYHTCVQAHYVRVSTVRATSCQDASAKTISLRALKMFPNIEDPPPRAYMCIPQATSRKQKNSQAHGPLTSGCTKTQDEKHRMCESFHEILNVFVQMLGLLLRVWRQRCSRCAIDALVDLALCLTRQRGE